MPKRELKEAMTRPQSAPNISEEESKEESIEFPIKGLSESDSISEISREFNSISEHSDNINRDIRYEKICMIALPDAALWTEKKVRSQSAYTVDDPNLNQKTANDTEMKSYTMPIHQSMTKGYGLRIHKGPHHLDSPHTAEECAQSAKAIHDDPLLVGTFVELNSTYASADSQYNLAAIKFNERHNNIIAIKQQAGKTHFVTREAFITNKETLQRNFNETSSDIMREQGWVKNVSPTESENTVLSPEGISNCMAILIIGGGIAGHRAISAAKKYLIDQNHDPTPKYQIEFSSIDNDTELCTSQRVIDASACTFKPPKITDKSGIKVAFQYMLAAHFNQPKEIDPIIYMSKDPNETLCIMRSQYGGILVTSQRFSPHGIYKTPDTHNPPFINYNEMQDRLYTTLEDVGGFSAKDFGSLKWSEGYQLKVSSDHRQPPLSWAIPLFILNGIHIFSVLSVFAKASIITNPIFYSALLCLSVPLIMQYANNNEPNFRGAFIYVDNEGVISIGPTKIQIQYEQKLLDILRMVDANQQPFSLEKHLIQQMMTSNFHFSLCVISTILHFSLFILDSNQAQPITDLLASVLNFILALTARLTPTDRLVKVEKNGIALHPQDPLLPKYHSHIFSVSLWSELFNKRDVLPSSLSINVNQKTNQHNNFTASQRHKTFCDDNPASTFEETKSGTNFEFV